MPDLVGGVAQFGGDPNAPIWVTKDAIIANCVDNDQNVPAFLNAVVGDACDGYLVSKLTVLQDSQDAYQQIISGSVPDPCTWLRYFGPLAFAQDFTVTAPTVQDTGGQYLVTAGWLYPYHLVTFAIESYDCWQCNVLQRTQYYAGPKPVELSVPQGLKTCDYEGQKAQIVGAGGQALTENDPFMYLIKAGTMSLQYLGPLLTIVSPGDILNGEVSMPIPPVPDGYPAPPSAPPLQGSAIVESLSDDDCVTIVERGGGFRTLADIANYRDGADSGEIADYDERMFVPTGDNYNYFLTLLNQVPVEFWQTVVVVEGTGDGDYVLTLAKMILAYDTADDATKTQWLQEQTASFILFDLLNAFVLADSNQLVAPVCQSLKTAVESNKVLIPGQVELVPATEDNSLDIQWDINFKAYMKLKLQRSTEMSDNDVVDLTARYCDGDQPVSVPLLTYRKDDGTLITEAPYKSLILDLLYQIRECCNPCDEYTPNPIQSYFFYGDNTSFAGDPNSESPDIDDLYRVVFNVIEDNFPKVVYFGTTPLKLLAKFAWRDANGRYDRIQWINTDKATFTVPRPGIVGFICHCYTGVALGATVRLKNTPSQPSALAPP